MPLRLGDRGVWLLLVVGAILAGTQPAQATIVNLADLNSQVSINTQSQAGMFNWTVDGVNQMFQQWYWFRVGSSGPEQSIDTLVHDPAVDESVSNANFNPGDERLLTRYTDPNNQFQIIVDYTLTGGQPGSGSSDVSEAISIHNLSRELPLDFHFFQYVDADLKNTLRDDSVAIINPNTALQTDGSVGFETVATPAPSHVETNYFNATLLKLNDATATTLNDNKGPVVNGDLTWAFQWDHALAPGETFLISKDKQITLIPEPTSLVLLASGLALGAIVLRRRRK